MTTQQDLNETQQNLLLHLQTNRHFIQQKVYDVFKMECLQEKQLKDLDTSKLQKTVLQIFDFGESIQMKQFYTTISPNIGKFIAQSYRNKKSDDDIVTDIEKLYNIINYCVMKGFPLKLKPKPIQKSVAQIKIHIQQINTQQIQKTPKKQQPKKQQPKKIIVKKPKTPQKVFQIPKYEMPDTNVGPRYLQKLVIQKPKLDDFDTINVEPIDTSFAEANKKAMRDRLHKMYLHYCTQQQNVGLYTTFDRIKQECEHMNVGKFVMFCNQTHLFDPKAIKKEKLVNYFKKIYPSIPNIDFDQFEHLLKFVDEIYVQQKKVSSGLSNFPSYQARLCLNSNKYKSLLTDVDIPFSVREKQGRQLKQYSIDSPRIQSLKNTEFKKNSVNNSVVVRSARESLDLRTIMDRNKEYLNNLTVRRKANPQGLNVSQIISLETLKNHRLPKIDWMINEQESDNLYLSEYKLDQKLRQHNENQGNKRTKDVAKAAKLRASQVERAQKSKRYQSINF